mmetsp:Transcript_23647/g.65633  ORF Transcript_23647/g.65633 Transcript_23647/m.65633 type:complete len:82 (+) Transcript_23647:3762-4007(+)
MVLGVERMAQTRQKGNNCLLPILVESEKSNNFQSRVLHILLPCVAYGSNAAPNGPNDGEHDENAQMHHQGKTSLAILAWCT